MGDRAPRASDFATGCALLIAPWRGSSHDADLKRADGLLGRDFLEHLTATIDSKDQQATLVPT